MDDFGQFEGHPDADQLNALMEDALPAAERLETLAHLAVCADCRAVVALVLPHMPPVFADEPVAQRGGERRWWQGWWQGWRIAVPAVAFAALAFGVVEVYRGEHGPAVRPVDVAGVQAPAALAPAGEPKEMARPAGTEPEVGAGDKALEHGAQAEKAARADAEERKERGAAQQAADRMAVAGSAAAGSAAVGSAAAGASAAPAKPMPAPARVAAGSAGTSVASGTGMAYGAGAAPAGSLHAPVVVAAAPAPLAPPVPVVGGAGELPSRLPTLAMVAEGERVVAIDAQHEVFASGDHGRSWVAVRAPWAGQALAVAGVPGAGVEARMAARTQPRFEDMAPPLPRETPRAGKAEAAGPAAGVAAGVAAGLGAGRGSVRGQVADATGAAIPQAQVTLQGAGGAPARTVRTDAAGRFLLEGVDPGQYTLNADALGFAGNAVPVAVKPGAATSAALTLPAGGAAETVEVSGAAARVDLQPVERRARKAAAPVFTLSTDRGEQWGSVDGVRWFRL